MRRDDRLITVGTCPRRGCVIQTTLTCKKCEQFVCRKHMPDHPCEQWQPKKAPVQTTGGE